jgi:hypothetical protein
LVLPSGPKISEILGIDLSRVGLAPLTSKDHQQIQDVALLPQRFFGQFLASPPFHIFDPRK